MILSHKGLQLKKEDLFFKKKINCSENFSYIPVQYKNKDLLLQTPDLFIPFCIKTFSDKCNKKYLDLSFQSDKNKETIHFINILQEIFEVVHKKYSNTYDIQSFIKESKLSKWMRFKIQEDALIFNQNKEKIEQMKE